MRALLHDDDADVRLAVVDGLRLLRDDDGALDALRELAEDTDARVRRQVERALRRADVLAALDEELTEQQG